MQEAGPTSTVSDWKPVADDVTIPDYTVKDLSPRKDYNFRIRAEMENGDISEPTPPIQYYRSQVPMSKEPFALGEYKPVEYEITLANRTYVDHLTKYVPPRLPIDKPEMVVINPETVELAWKPARVPDSIKYSSNLTYTIEVRNPPSFEWRELVSGLKQLNNTVKKLHPRVDYIFRIRAWNEYGPSEPSLPVSLYRPVQHDPNAAYDDDEAFEKDWELRFGQQVPPKLPMDTPKIITQSPEFIWFSWIPARIPAYATQTPITYVIEVKEPPGTSWKRAHDGLLDCQFTYEGMNPTRDYHIRVKAETQFGPSEPTLPIFIKRSGSRPGSRRSSLERDLMAEEVKVDTTALENLTTGVPPRMSSNRPLSSNVQPTSLTLSWPAGRVPTYVKNQTISYIIEKREPPGHIWTVLAKEIPATRYDIKGLNPDQDYMFRVRARNDFGTSDPTLPMTLYRERDDYVPQKIRSRSGSRDSIQALVSRRRRSSSSILDFDYLRSGSEEVDVCVKDQIPTQPEYTSAPKWDKQYGVEGKKGKMILQVRGFPLPTIHWYLNEEKLDFGDNYTASLSVNGTVTLEIKQVRQDSFGTYKCYAENEHGAAVKFVKYECADPPTVLEPLRDVFTGSHTSAKFTCRVDGVPSPSAKWMKDWHPLKDSTRIKVLHESPDVWSLEITNALSSDAGLYACTMENMAGKVTMTARLVIEDQEPGPPEVELKKSPIEDSYHILEEIGRSRQGVIRRVIEKQTGEALAANFIFARNKAQKNFFMTEFEILRLLNQYDNVLKLHDAYETDRSLVLVTELLTGSDLLSNVVADSNWTEAKAADVIKSILGVLQILGDHNIQHLEIKPSNIYLCGEDNKEVKLINFALSRQLIGDEDLIHNYGSIGYASPEQVGEDIITDKTDIWGVGVLAYILLAGESPFKGTNDFEVLNKTKTCDWEFNKAFVSFSEEAKDFIGKLLLKNPSDRLSVDNCLKHPWLTTTNDAKLNNEKLNIFNEADRKKREASKSFITANLQSFNKILHGASALYQPAMDQDTGEIIFPDTEEYGNFLSEDAWYEWQLHYMDDPDTQNFPLDNKDFTVRESRDSAADGDLKTDKKEQDTSDIDSAIMFRNKIQTTPFIVGEDVTFTCTVISPNSPAIVTWYRDEQLLGEDTYRTEPQYSAETGEASLTIRNPKDYDAAIYKCVARNKDGRVSCEARLLLGDVPGKPGRPVVTQASGSEVFLTWTGPVSDGNSYILGYRIDFKRTEEDTWTRGPFVTDEYALVSGLVPSSEYIFRVSCHNKYGASQYSWASLPVKTGGVDTPRIEIAKYLKPVLQFSSFDKQQLILQAASRRPSLTVVADAKLNDGKPEDSYNVLESVAKGRYGEYKLCSSIANNKHYVMKVMPFKADDKDKTMYEFNILSSLRQVNIITVYEGFLSEETLYVIFERFSGVNVVQYLCLRKFYSEEIVSRIVRQILDGLQYLQQTGIVHLNLQPSSVVMATRRRLHVKLRDFTQARKLENGQEEKITPSGYPDFIAPEILREEPAGFPADVWGLGALTFVMLSGTSPFGGANRQETLNRIVFDRYSSSDMYDNVSKEAVSFVTKMLKRLPKNRPTVNKCLDSKWLQLSDSMIKSRNSHLFRTETLRDFSELYLERKGDNQYMDMTGVSGETLAKPTVGPPTEPIRSKRLPKYRRSISKPQPAAELDISSATSLASDFSSILDKIDSLREAIYSGADLPERKTKTRKPLREESDIDFSKKSVRQEDFLTKAFKQDIDNDLIIPEKAVGAELVETKIGKPKDIIDTVGSEVKTEKVEEKLVEASVSDTKKVEESIEGKDLETVEKDMSVKDESATKKTDLEIRESSSAQKPGKDIEEIDGNILSKSKKTAGKFEFDDKKNINISQQDLDEKKVKAESKMNDKTVEANKSKDKKESNATVEALTKKDVSKQNKNGKGDVLTKLSENSADVYKKSKTNSDLNGKKETGDNKKTPYTRINQNKSTKVSEKKAVNEKSLESDKSKFNTSITKEKVTPVAASGKQSAELATEKPILEEAPAKLSSEAVDEKSTPKVVTEKLSEMAKVMPSTEAAAQKPVSEPDGRKPSSELLAKDQTQVATTVEKPTPEIGTKNQTPEAAEEKPKPEEKSTSEKAVKKLKEATEKPSPEAAATEKPSSEKPSTDAGAEKSISEKPTPENSIPEKPTPENSIPEKPTPEAGAEKSIPEKPTPKAAAEKPTPDPSAEKPGPDVSTEKPTQEKSIPEAAAEKLTPEKPTPVVSAEKPSPEKPTPNAAAERSTEEKSSPDEPSPCASAEKPTPEATPEKPTPEIAAKMSTPEKPSADASAEKPTPEATQEKPTPEIAVEKSTQEKPLLDASAEMPTPEAATEKPIQEIADKKSTPEKPASDAAAETPIPETSEKCKLEKPTPEAATEKPTPEATAEKSTPSATAETKPETSEIKTEIVEDIVKPMTVMKDENVPNIESQEPVVVEEVIEPKEAVQEKTVPNLEVKESSLKENETEIAAKDVSKESIVDEKRTVKENEITEELTAGDELKTNTQTDEVDLDNTTESDEGLRASDTKEERKEGAENEIKTDNDNIESKTDNIESKFDSKESKVEDSKTDNIESKSDNVQTKNEDNNKVEQEIDKRISEVVDAEKRESVSTVSTESEYLDALSCADNKDMKCQHNHESTPDSLYATPRNSVAEEDLQKFTEFSEKESSDKSDIQRSLKSVEANEKEIINKSDTEKTQKSVEENEKEIIDKSNNENILKSLESNEKADVTEKSDTESVKEKDDSCDLSTEKMDKAKDEKDDSSGLSKEEMDKAYDEKDGKDKIEERDGDILDKEKKILAEAEEVAERVVTEALDDALKVAEC